MSLQRRGSLPLATLKTECSLQISAHDLIVLCRLESHAIGYSGSQPPAIPRSGSLLMRGRSKERGRGRQKAVVVDIRPQEEYPSTFTSCVTALDNFPSYSSIIWSGLADYLCNGEVLIWVLCIEILDYCRFRLGHVPHSLSLPHMQVFQPDGSLAPSPTSSALTSHRGRIMIVVANKGESGPVVCVPCCSLLDMSILTPSLSPLSLPASWCG